jgi:hypothetical protein
LPSSIESIESEAFINCLNLTDITYQGTMDEWHNIGLGYNWHSRQNHKLGYEIGGVVHCSDGDIHLENTED